VIFFFFWQRTPDLVTWDLENFLRPYSLTSVNESSLGTAGGLSSHDLQCKLFTKLPQSCFSGKNLGMIRHFLLVRCKTNCAERGFSNAALTAKIRTPDITAVSKKAFSSMLCDFFGVFILAKTRCLELTTNNIFTRTH